MFDDDLLNVIPDIDSGPGVPLPGELVEVDDVRKRSRLVLRSWADRDRLYSLDEAVGTVVALTSVALAIGALVFEGFRFPLGWLSAISTVFFWVVYRYAKAKHSIELRLGVISGFVMFILFSLLYLIVLVYSFVAQPYEQEIRTILALPFTFAILVLFLALQFDYSKVQFEDCGQRSQGNRLVTGEKAAMMNLLEEALRT